MSEHKWLGRMQTLLYFAQDGDINPESSAQVFTMGSIGFMFSLMGENFYRSLAEEGLSVFGEIGVERMFAAVSDAHLRLMKRALRTADITQHGPCWVHEHRLNLICIENSKVAAQDSLF